MSARVSQRRASFASWVVYGAGFAQGLTLVTIPATGPELRSLHAITDTQYGALFLPQVVFVMMGSLLGGAMTGRGGLRWLLAAALLCGTLSQGALAAAATAEVPSPIAYRLLLTATALLGLSFGLGAAPLNSLPPRLFPAAHDASITAMHMTMGVGLCLSPLLAARFVEAGALAGFPWLLAALCTGLAAAAAVARVPEGGHSEGPSSGPRPWRDGGVWLFFAVAALYGVAEGTFGNWALLFLVEERSLTPTAASAALSAFWAAVAGARLLLAGALVRIPARSAWLTLPGLMATAFLALPLARTPASAVALFAFAGAVCSGVVPLTVSLASRRFPTDAPWIASLVIAGIMAGVGLGSLALGPLRETMPLERLYPLSCAWPLLILALMAALVRRGDVPA